MILGFWNAYGSNITALLDYWIIGLIKSPSISEEA
jgi:hypothetical protein